MKGKNQFHALQEGGTEASDIVSQSLKKKRR